ncbi:hypothetical protein DWY69_10965 [Eisenbergiella massiliensis]|uniref:Uncharacterized protein n=1 Tax=Eisenbergiella massiliensis TaxID=1720294 RepID=A0A3E3IYQ1_9FIRM|nr:hypothetical protein DWY69_10965 [Eisenbergiella massiliensis]
MLNKTACELNDFVIKYFHGGYHFLVIRFSISKAVCKTASWRISRYEFQFLRNRSDKRRERCLWTELLVYFLRLFFGLALKYTFGA